MKCPTSSSFAAVSASAERVMYCGVQGVEGAYIKVNIDSKSMCWSAGQWGVDYCKEAAKTYAFAAERTGAITISGQNFTFREYLGTSSSTNEVQWIRVYNVASNPSGADVVYHRADLAGGMTLFSSGLPSAEAKDGNSVCVEGEDSSF